jgi:RNA polymerase sigma factor (sigma-70 family)
MDRYRHLVEALSADDYRRLRGYRVDSRSSFAAWLTVVSRRLSVDFERSRGGRADRGVGGTSEDRRKIRRRLLDLVGTAEDPDSLASSDVGVAETLESEERREAVERALGELPPRDRLLIKLRFEDDLSVREIADVMGFPSVFHVYRRLRPVLASIKGTLVSEGVDDASE